MLAMQEQAAFRETDIFRALADPTRRAVLERLAAGERTVGELKAGFEVSQPAISQHLAALKRAGLVSERKAGRNTFYSAAPRGLAPLIGWIDRYQGFWHERIRRLNALLEEMDE
jgi:DNA-binding transcriptional ArsR family regulator